ncbi:MAG: hypothetical protein IBX68_04940 [Dehalococcoidia bacterium]|nr:hypothetical protein [Dehalococcoidia bacterium]
MEEEKKAQVGLSAARILYLAAGLALLVGLLHAILAAAESYTAAAFFEGVLWTLLVGGILFGLSSYLERK